MVNRPWFGITSIPLFESWIFWVAAILGSCIIGFVIAFVLLPKKQKIRPLSDETIAGILKNLGGVENIKDVAIDGARIKFVIHNLDLCNLNEIRNLGAVGVFVSGNAVKFMLTNNADHLIEEIQLLKKGE